MMEEKEWSHTGHWQLPDLQQRYRGFFSLHIERLIRQHEASQPE